MVEVSTPGKLMLFGDHAVVYGRPCIVTAVDQRMHVAAEYENSNKVQVSAPEMGINDYSFKPNQSWRDGPKGIRFALAAAETFRDNYGLTGVRITTKSEFSSMVGFGSSSAVTVGVIAALAKLTENNLDNKELFDLAYKTVLVVQGVGSGFDLAAAIWGGTLWFVNGGEEINPLEVADIPIVVGYSGVKADTVNLINQVAERRKNNPKIVKGIFDLMGEITIKVRVAMGKNEWENLGSLMNIYQGLLEALGVSTFGLARLNYAVREAGAWGAKLSGAGGGDCMICVAQDRDKIEKAIVGAGGVVQKVRLGAEGVRSEEV